jgi:branched-chain amino acid transport system substrate-binding protein
MMKQLTRRTLLAAAPAALALGGPLLRARPVCAAKQYGPGVTDTEITIGNTCFYSGPASSCGTIGRAMAAYYKMVNDQGGVNGRKINFISYDDAYSPPKTVEMTRKLVEEGQVFLDAGPLGTPINSAIWHYMNQHKVPQLFVSTGATKWDDPKGPSLDHRLAAELPERRAHLRRLRSNAQAGRQNRRALSGRRFRQGLSEGVGRRTGRKGGCDDRRQSVP